MRLVVERQARSDNGRVSFVTTFRVVPEQPVPRSAQYLADVPLETLARHWFCLQEPAALDDKNAILVAGAENWSDATLRTMITQAGLIISAPSPIIAAAVEERLRRALALLSLSDEYDEKLLRTREMVVELPSNTLTPSGKAISVIEA